MHHPQAEDGTITAFVAVLTAALLAVAGLAYDGGQIIKASAHARDLAGAAARAGTQQLAPEQLHAGRAYLDPVAAHEQATAFLAATGTLGTVEVSDTQVRVTVTVTQPMRLLPVSDRIITVTATAATVSDVLEAGP